MRINRVVYCLLFWLVPNYILAQNLVPNPGFELFFDCPNGLQQLKKTKNWYAGNTGTPEYYRTDCKFVEGKAHYGKGYTGLILFGGYSDIVEYIGVELLDTLKEHTPYCVSFYTRARSSVMYIDQIGVLFSREKTYLDMWAPIYQPAQVTSKYNEPIVPELGWHEVTGNFIAEGGERFLTIGNFVQPERHTKYVDEWYGDYEPGWNSYYLIDDVSVVELPVGKTCQMLRQQKVVKSIEQRDTIVLEKTLYFDFDEAELAASELKQLQQFITTCSTYQLLQYEVIGHTDNQGTNTYNYLLSEQRTDYILTKFVQANIGGAGKKVFHGEDRPADSNRTVSGRAKNRRVQIKIKAIDRKE